jgi:hypothetical protein
MIKTDLRQGNPVIYRGTNSVGANGHAFVIEGFDIEGSWYEINFGWNGASNGSYTIDDITPGNSDYSFNQAAVFGIKPNNSTYRDRYELDNTWETSSFMTVNATQQGHSIDPKSDVDWTWFYNDTAGTVTIDTINSNGDTVMRLYDYYGNYIAYDDDGGVDYLSKITRSLAVGRYYIKVQSYGGDSTISSYDLRVSQ